MKLQVALDTLLLPEAIELVEDLRPLIDIVEIGTPFILRDGTGPILKTKELFPELDVLADFKIMDAGAYEAELAFSAGADIVTVLGAAHDDTVEGVTRVARNMGRQVMVDLIAVKDKPRRAIELDHMGVDFFCLHTPTDTGISVPQSDTRAMNAAGLRGRLAIAGGITPSVLEKCGKLGPDLVVVGGFITQHEDPVLAAKQIRALFPTD